MTKLDYSLIQRELLIALRGRLSQSRVNQKMGFKSNRVHRWETGEAAIPWREFCRLCDVLKAPLATAGRDALRFENEIEDWPALIRHLTGGDKQQDIAARTGVSRYTVSRWLSRKLEPSADQILRLIHSSFSSLTYFLSTLADPKRMPSVHEELEREREERELHYKYPWVAAALLWLRTVEYNSYTSHPEGFLAKKLGIPLQLEREIMKKLLDVGAIVPEGKIFAPRLRHLDVGGHPEGNRRVREYWTARCLKFIQTQPFPMPGNQWAYMILNTSPETEELIRARYLQFYQDINTIILSSSTPADRVRLLNLQILNIEDLPGGAI